jgi:hypothetical protein
MRAAELKMNKTELRYYTTSSTIQTSTDDREGGFVRRSWVPPDEESIPTDVRVHPEAVSPGALLADIVSFCDGKVTIDFPGNSDGPLFARSTVALRNLKDKVLIVRLPDGEPLIVGQIYSSIPILDIEEESSDVFIKGRRVRIETGSDLVLIAGSTKVHLDARGKLVTSADQIVSRARFTNKLQGGSVQIN